MPRLIRTASFAVLVAGAACTSVRSTPPSSGGAGSGGTGGEGAVAGGAGVGGAGAGGGGSAVPDATIVSGSLGPTSPVLDGASVYFVTGAPPSGMYTTGVAWTVSRVPSAGGDVQALTTANYPLTYAVSDASAWYFYAWQLKNGAMVQPTLVAVAAPLVSFGSPAPFYTDSTFSTGMPVFAAQDANYLFFVESGALWRYSKAVYGPTSISTAAPYVNVDARSVWIGSDDVLHYLERVFMSGTTNTLLVQAISTAVDPPQAILDGDLPAGCVDCVHEPGGAGWLCRCQDDLKPIDNLARVSPSGTTQTLVAGLDAGALVGMAGNLYVFQTATLLGAGGTSETFAFCDPTMPVCLQQSVPEGGVFGLDAAFIYYQDSTDHALRRTPIAPR